MHIILPSRVWVVIAAYNEAHTIARIVEELKHARYNVVVVDDGSIDGTSSIASQAGAVVVRHPMNLGQGAALQTGLEYALSQAAEALVTFDADGQHRVADVHALLVSLVQEAADFALGSRFLGPSPQIPASRAFLLRAGTLFTRFTTGLHVTDTHNGLRAMTRRGASAICLQQNRMAHASEILEQIARSGLRYVETAVTIDYTPYSLRKGQRLHDAVAVLIDLLTRRLNR